jgi:hypothetical protein
MTAFRRLMSVAAGSCCALVAASVALAAPAGAATISVNKACYVNSASGLAQMTITGAGFNAGDVVDISGGSTIAQATVAADGSFSTTANAPELSTTGPGTLTTMLTASDFVGATGQTIAATTPVRSANLAVATSPGSVPVKDLGKRKVTFTFSGFVPGKRIYGYYLHKRVVAKNRFAKASGPCGTLKQKALLFPGRHVTRSAYTVVFESVGHYTKSAFPKVSGKLQFFSL